MTKKPTNRKTASSRELLGLVRGRRDRGRAPTTKHGPGRPPRTDAPERLVVRIPGELRQRLDYRAVDERRTLGEIVADALERYLER